MSFFGQMDTVDAVTARGPSESTIEELRSLIAQEPALGSYAAAQLQGLGWLPLLAPRPLAAGAAPALVLPVTAAADYLARCARSEPPVSGEAILGAMRALSPYVGHNARSRLAKAAALLEPCCAEQWAEHETLHVLSQASVQSALALALGSLAARLAGDGVVNSALSLTAALLDVLPDPEAEQKRLTREREDVTAIFSPEPTFRIAAHEYDEILEKSIPALVAAAPEKTFKLLSDLVEKVMAYGLYEPEQAKPNDLSMVRRPAIEGHEQNREHEFGQGLISAWRDTAEGIAKAHPERLPTLVEQLEARGWDIFNRLALHLLRVVDSPPPELVEGRLTASENFRNYGLHHEMWNLLHDRFAELSARGKAAVMRQIETGVELAGEGELDSMHRERYRRYDEYRWLLAIEPHLDGTWIARLQALREEFGDPGMPPDFLSWMGGAHFVEPNSPLTQEQIAAMPVDELIRWMKAWRPTGQWEAPTPSALGEKLTALVESAPEKWAGELALFQDSQVDPTYQRSLVSGFAKLLESGKPIPWPPVLAFCQWLVGQPVEVHDRELPARVIEGFYADRDRRPGRIEVARLVRKALSYREDSIACPSLELRSRFWVIIKALSDDSNPDREEDGKGDRGAADHLTLSLNTVRGVALHAVMEYSMWVYRQTEADLHARAQRRPNWADMPEVRVVLEARFDVEHGFGWSATDRAVLGEWLPQLVHVDGKWVTEHLSDLFPEAPGLRAQRDALWKAYLNYSRLYGDVYDVIRPQYFSAVRALAGPTVAGEDGPAFRLSQQVMILFMWGKTNLEEGELVAEFFAGATPELAGKALLGVGRMLDTKEEIQEERIKRLRDLWEWRVRGAGGVDRMTVQERAAFGYWFASGKFEASWALGYLPHVLGSAGECWADDRILRRLNEVFRDHPRECLASLRSLVEGGRDRWCLIPKEDGPAWLLLDKALSHNDSAIRSEAESIVNLLGSQEHLGYRELLKRHKES